MEAKIVDLLSHLRKVKSVGDGKFVACCPAHDDHSPSLSIKLSSEGVILLKCWAGCEVSSIVEAVGMSMSDLFPSTSSGGTAKPDRVDYRKILGLLRHEIYVVSIFSSSLQAGEQLSTDDFAVLARAVDNIQKTLVVADVYA
jgi:hypothetical protein